MKTEKQLREVYDFPKGRTVKKVLLELEKHSIRFIETSPFLVMSTFDSSGHVDTSPRGGQPGFVKIISFTEIAIPDSRGNNRLDSFKNIVDTGRIVTIFFIPGIDETLRINGEACIQNTAETLELFSQERQSVKACIVIKIEEVFLHCAKALMRSGLWSAESQIQRASFPTMGEMLKDQLNSTQPAESQEAMVKRYEANL